MAKIKVLHLLAGGSTGGIESLIKEYNEKSVHDHIFLFIYKGGIITDELINKGNKVYLLNKSNKQFISILKDFIQICIKDKIQVVMSHHSSPLFKILLVFTHFLFPNIIKIAYAHANALDICEYKKRGFKIRKFVHCFGFKVSDGIIAISQSVANSLVKYLNVEKNKIRLIYNGVSINKFFNNKNKNDDNKIKFTFVGRLIKEKGVQNILQVFSKIDKNVLNKFEFQIVGDGPYKDDLIELTKELNLPNVYFLGMRNDITSLLSNSDFFIHLPLWEEGFGIAIIEAMASGNICISLNKGGIPEIVENEISGFLFDENIDLISHSVCKLINQYSNNKLNHIKLNAIERAKQFSIEKFATSLDNYIFDLQFYKKEADK